MVSATEIVALQNRLTREWHRTTEARPGGFASGEAAGSGASGEWLTLLARQHRANFDLWHIEDEARAPEASDSQIAQVKRRIDQTNQLRSDLVEGLDLAIQDWLKARGLPNPDAPLNSEPPGMMIDRLSILALKIYHTEEETRRESATEVHRQKNTERLAVLKEQRNDLTECLKVLWTEVLAGTRRFKLYRQMKMYNDPELNPLVYTHKGAHPPC